MSEGLPGLNGFERSTIPRHEDVPDERATLENLVQKKAHSEKQHTEAALDEARKALNSSDARNEDASEKYKRQALREWNRKQFLQDTREEVRNIRESGSYRDVLSPQSDVYGKAMAYYYAGRAIDLSRTELAQVLAVHELAREGKLDATEAIHFGQLLQRIRSGDADWGALQGFSDPSQKQEILALAQRELLEADPGATLPNLLQDRRFLGLTEQKKAAAIRGLGEHAGVNMERLRFDSRAMGSSNRAFAPTDSQVLQNEDWHNE